MCRVRVKINFNFLEVSHIRSVWQLFEATRCFDDTKRIAHRVQPNNFDFVPHLKVYSDSAHLFRN